MEMLYTCSSESLKGFIEGYEKWQRNGQVIHPELDERYQRINNTPAFKIVMAEVTMLLKMKVVPAIPYADRENGTTRFYHDIICWCRRYYNGKEFDVRF